jgi:hypothetical protein
VDEEEADDIIDDDNDVNYDGIIVVHDAARWRSLTVVKEAGSNHASTKSHWHAAVKRQFKQRKRKWRQWSRKKTRKERVSKKHCQQVSQFVHLVDQYHGHERGARDTYRGRGEGGGGDYDNGRAASCPHLVVCDEGTEEG